MANKIVSFLILIIGAVLGMAIRQVVGGSDGFALGWAIFIISLLPAYLNYKKNPFKL